MKILVWTLVLGCAAAAGCQGTESCPLADTDIVFPADEAPHRVAMEWWYYTGHLWTQADRRYGFEVSFFQSFAFDQVGYAGHFAISDPDSRAHHTTQNIVAPEDIYPRFDLRVGDWTMRGDGTTDHLHATMEAFAVDLACTRTKPVAIHADRGLIEMGGGALSYYYSKTRLDVRGDLGVDGVAEPVTGTAWMDHQWGDFDVFASDGWDWFSVQLDDATEIMVFLLHFKETGTDLTGGTFVAANGCQTRFHEVNVVHQGGEWESPRTGAVYPLGWSLEVPSLELSLDIEPTFEAQEMDSRATTLNVYWEGEVEAAGTRQGRRVEGLGYVELAGYGPWGPGS